MLDISKEVIHVQRPEDKPKLGNSMSCDDQELLVKSTQEVVVPSSPRRGQSLSVSGLTMTAS